MAKRVVIALLVLMSTVAGSAAARTLHVCRHGCAYRQVVGAVAAAHNGDSVNVARGSYRGGFAITKSLTVKGAGAGKTTIKGGGPVITVGRRGGSGEPTVTIGGVTVTGGITHSAFGGTVEALGGGVYVPSAAKHAAPTTLTIIDSAITGNVAAPTKAVDAGMPCGPGNECQFAHAGGGGIDSWGHVTIRDSRVSDNQAGGPLTSDADGGGIYSQDGTLTVDHSVVTGNRALAGVPNGRFAEGAGIMVDSFFSDKGTCVAPRPPCRFVLRDSVIADNVSRLTTAIPLLAADGNFIMLANAGGVHVGDNAPTTVVHSRIIGNSAMSRDLKGEAAAVDAGMLVGASPLTMRDSKVSHNMTATTALTVADVAPVGDALEVDGSGSIANTAIEGNVATTFSPHGTASTTGGLGVFDTDLLTVKGSRITRNVTAARSDTGSVSVLGGAVFNNTRLALDHVEVSRNTAGVSGPAGTAQGGGIWNGNLVTGPPALTLNNSRVVSNALRAGPGIPRQGGGMYTTFPIALMNTPIAGNQPDQCVGCTLVAPMVLRGAARAQREPASGRRWEPLSGASGVRGRSLPPR